VRRLQCRGAAGHTASTVLTSADEAVGPGSPWLPRALQALAHEAVVTEDGSHFLASLEPSPPGASVVLLAGRATRVP
jgi:hypothetical protein